jgi:hypothetical protein
LKGWVGSRKDGFGIGIGVPGSSFLGMASWEMILMMKRKLRWLQDVRG